MTVKQQIANQEANAHLIGQLAGLALDTLRRAIDASDGYGHGQTDGGSGKNNISDPTGSAVLGKDPHWTERDIITAYLEQRELQDATVLRVLLRYAVRKPVPRCEGAIDPTCTNAASEHHDPVTGASSTGMCDDCWLIACRKCHSRSQEAYRGGLCGTCRKAEDRAKVA